MKILALDTTTEISSIAVTDESGVIGEYNLAHRMDLSRRLMPNIIAMLKDCGLGMKDLEAVAVSLGPGSFTGIRIGVVTAKTLAQTLGIPIAGVITLDLLARQFAYLPDALVCPIIKVRKGEVYHAIYRVEAGTVGRVSEYDAGTTESLIEVLQDTGVQPIIFCGDALKDNLDALRAELGSRVIPTPQPFSYGRASTLAQLGIERISSGQADDLYSLVPFYIRRSTPELRLEAACSAGEPSMRNGKACPP